VLNWTAEIDVEKLGDFQLVIKSPFKLELHPKASFVQGYPCGRLCAVYAVEWEESERGWGVRPDGISLHYSKEVEPLYAFKNTVKSEENFDFKEELKVAAEMGLEVGALVLFI